MKTILLTAALLCAMQFGNAQFLHFAFNPDSIPNAAAIRHVRLCGMSNIT